MTESRKPRTLDEKLAAVAELPTHKERIKGVNDIMKQMDEAAEKKGLVKVLTLLGSEEDVRVSFYENVRYRESGIKLKVLPSKVSFRWMEPDDGVDKEGDPVVGENHKAFDNIKKVRDFRNAEMDRENNLRDKLAQAIR
jgi:hypothetical protein